MNDAELMLVLKAKNLASKPVDQLSKSLGGVKGGAAKAGSALLTLGKFAAIGLGALAVGAIAVGPEILNMAVKIESMGKKAKIVFGDQLGMVTKWAETNASAMGLTSLAATGLAANFGDLLVPMGFTREQAAKMSTEVVGLSGALSEWSGGTRTAAEVSQILAKAMLGERESLKELGISITDADVKARLLKNGTDKLTGAQLEQAKATATQQLIFEKSADAQAAYAAGGGSLARKQAELKAKFDQVVETLIVALIPALTTVVTWVSDLFKWIGTLGSALSGSKKSMAGFTKDWNSLAKVLGAIVGALVKIIHYTAKAIDELAKMGAMPKAGVDQKAKLDDFLNGHAAGGWVGLNGPEIGLLGEKGPEYIVPNHKLGGMGGGGQPVTIQLVMDGKTVGKLVDERLYYAIQKAAPAMGRS